MTELIKFIFSDFWVFVGFLCVLGVVAYAIANLRIFSYVKEEHNETFNQQGGLTDSDKMFIMNSLKDPNLSTLRQVIVVDDPEYIIDPIRDVLYLVKNKDDDKYTLVRYSDILGRVEIESDDIELVNYGIRNSNINWNLKNE